jgi:transposase
MMVMRQYSEGYKIEVVRALESGRYSSVRAVQDAYGIRGAMTVKRWVRAYGKEHILNKVVHVMRADEETEVKKLRQRVKELERALADAHIDSKLDAAYLKIACRKAGIEDVDGFKKKHGGTQ